MSETEARTFVGHNVEWTDSRANGHGGGVGFVNNVSAREATIRVVDNFTLVSSGSGEMRAIRVPLEHVTLKRVGT